MLDNTILAQAIAYGLGFTFGLFQTVLKRYVTSEWKAFIFVVLATASIIGAYYALLSGLVIIQVGIAAIGAAYAATGSVDFYKKDMQES